MTILATFAPVRECVSPPAPWDRRVLRFKPGEPVGGGLHGDGLICFVRSGWVSRSRMLSDGRRQILELLLPGDHCRHPDTPPTGDILTALGRCEVARAPAAEVREAVNASPALQADMADAERRRRARLEELIISLGQRNAPQRMAHLFCEMFVRLGGAAGASAMPCPLTQTDLADLLGLSVVHTNRTVQTLRRLQMVEFSRGRLKILDHPALVRLADFSPDYLC